MNITTIKGNLFGGLQLLEEPELDRNYKPHLKGIIYAYAHCIAEDGNWGAGIAPQFMDVFDCGWYVKRNLQRFRAEHEGLPFIPWALVFPTGQIKYWRSNHEPLVLAHLITKRYTYGKPTVKTMEASLDFFKYRMRKIIELVGQWNSTECVVRIPKIGCGLDKLQWPDVEKTIQDVFYDTNFEFEVYDLKGK